MTPSELKAARRALRYTCAGLAEAVGVASGRTVRRWEAGSVPVPGPVARLLAIWLEQPDLAPVIRRGRSPSEPVTATECRESLAALQRIADEATSELVAPLVAKIHEIAVHRHAWTPYTNGDVDWDECEECGAQANERPAQAS